MMSPTCQFYCLGYSASSRYRGLENLHIASLWALVAQSPALSSSDRAFVEHYNAHYILPERDELPSLTPEWFVNAKRLWQLATTLPDTQLHLLELGYHAIAAVDMRGDDATRPRDTQFIITAAQYLGFQNHHPSVTFLGYDLVEPHSMWSVLTHASEWGSERFHGNENGLCPTRDDVQIWLQQYSRSDDAFRLPADENIIVALYHLAEV